MKVSTKKIVKFIAYSFISLFVVIFCALYFLLATTAGMRFAVSKVNDYFSDTLKITANITNGDLLHGLKLDDYFEVNVFDIVIVRANKIDLSYSVSNYFLKDVFLIEHLKTDKLEVELTYKGDDGEEDPTPLVEDNSDPFRLDFLVKIKANDVEVKDFAYLSDVVDVFVPRAKLELEAHDSYASVTKGEAFDPLVHLKYEGDDIPSEKLPTILTYDNGNGAIEKITDIDLPLDPALYNLTLHHGRYYQDSYDSGYFDAEVNALWEHTLLQVFSVKAKHQLGEVDVSGTMDFIDYYNTDFEVHAKGSKSEYNLSNYDSALYGLEGNFTLKGSLVDLNLDANATSPEKIKIIARMNTLSDEVPCFLSIEAPVLKYPLNVKEKAKALHQHTSIFSTQNTENLIDAIDKIEKNLSASVQDSDLDKNGISFTNTKLKIEGAIFTQLGVNLSSSISGHGFTKTNVLLDTALTTKNAHINAFKLDGLLGNRKVHGSVDGDFEFETENRFLGNVSFKAGDAKDLSESLAGSLSLQSDIDLSFAENLDTLLVRIDKLNSNFYLNGHKASLDFENLIGDIDEGFEVDSIKFVQDDNKINLAGSISKNSLLNGSVNISNLEKIFPEFSGSITGRMRVEGDLKEPSINLAGRSGLIKNKDISVSKLVFDSTLDFSNKYLNISVMSNSLRVGSFLKPYRKCSFDLSGDLLDHRLTFSCGSGTGSYISAQGHYNEKTKDYNANVSNMMLVSNIVDPIVLKEPVDVHYNLKKQSGRISKIILSDGIAIAKTSDVIFSPNTISTSLDLQKVNLETIQRYFPNDIQPTGMMSLHSDIKFVNQVPEIQARVTATGGQIQAYSALLPYDKVSLKLDINKALFSSDINVSLSKNQGTLDISTQVSDIYNSKKLSGNINLKDLNLEMFTAVSKSLNALDGKANVKGSLDGTLANPLFFGQIKVKGSADPSYSIGTFNKFNLLVNANGDHGSLDGVFTLNETDINIKGNLDWVEGPKGRISLDADKLPVFLLSYGEALVNIHTVATIDRIIKVTGNVDIPSALIKFKNLDTDMIEPSKDEIFVDSNTNLHGLVLDKKKASTLNNDMEIEVGVTLGDDVKVNAMGLRANAVGGIIVSKKELSKKVMAQGKISLDHASADLYGHKFIFNIADAIFKDSINNPKLYVEVVADPSTMDDEVLAGVKVTGTAEHPTVTLFSKPAMSKNEILSYLLYGHGLEKNNSVTNSDGTSTQLLMSLGLGTTTDILNSVVGIFGMDGVQLGSSGSGNETQVEVQTYLTNKMRLSYGYGVYNSVNEFKVRYELVRRLYIEFISSMDHSVDLIYSFETN